MKFGVSVAILLAICAIAAAQVEYTQYTVDHYVTAKDKYTYVFSMQKCDAKSEWTIHGLWPQWGQSCGKGFDEKVLNPIRAELDKNWLSCPGHSSTNVQFWTHEWTKHGTCTNFTQLQYFTESLKLHQRVKSKCAQTNGECRLCIDRNLQQC